MKILSWVNWFWCYINVTDLYFRADCFSWNIPDDRLWLWLPVQFYWFSLPSFCLVSFALTCFLTESLEIRYWYILFWNVTMCVYACVCVCVLLIWWMSVDLWTWKLKLICILNQLITQSDVASRYISWLHAVVSGAV